MKLTPSRGKPADDLEQLFKLGPAEHRRGLVEHDDAGVARQGPGDLDHLALGDAQIGDRGPRDRPETPGVRRISSLRRIVSRQSTTPKRVLGSRPRNRFSATLRCGASIVS